MESDCSESLLYLWMNSSLSELLDVLLVDISNLGIATCIVIVVRGEVYTGLLGLSIYTPIWILRGLCIEGRYEGRTKKR